MTISSGGEGVDGVRKGWWWVVLLLLGFTTGANAAGVGLTAAQADYDLGYHLEWLRDSGGSLSVHEVRDAAPSRWTQGDTAVPNLGYSDDTIWFRVRLNNWNAGERWYLAINYPLIRNLDVYVLRAGQVAQVFQTGDRYEFAARPVAHRDFIFPLTILQNETLDVYLQVSGPYALQMPLRLLDERRMLQQDSLAALAHGLFFGFVLVMAVYNLFLFLGTRERSYLYYVLFSLSIGMFQWVQQGFAYQLFWPSEVAWQNRATGLFIHLSLISSFFFVSEFLQLRATGSWIYRVFQVIAWCSGLIFLLSPWIGEFYVMRIGVLLSVPACLLAMVGGWSSWRSGRSDARVFAAAWAIFLLGVFLLALNKLGIIPRNFVTEHGAEVGTVVELALLALALAGRINRERAQRIVLEQQTRELERSALLSKERALELERLSNEHLERSVRERTEDLHRALAELSNVNRKLEQLSTQDPVTGVGNENSFLKALAQEWDRAYRNSEELSLLVVELDGYRDILMDYGQVAAEECLKSVADILGRTICRPADVIARYGDKVFGVLLPGTSAAGARFLAERVADQVGEKPFDFGICQICASISVGIASVQPTRPDHYRELLLSAESAVYVAQNNGGNQIQQALDPSSLRKNN